jgi:hypothetical protein
MRAAIVVTVALALAVGSTVAVAQNRATTTQATLAPGQPAGLKQAQMGSNTLPILLGAGVVAGGIALAASGNDDNRNPVAATTTTAP